MVTKEKEDNKEMKMRTKEMLTDILNHIKTHILMRPTEMTSKRQKPSMIKTNIQEVLIHLREADMVDPKCTPDHIMKT